MVSMMVSMMMDDGAFFWFFLIAEAASEMGWFRMNGCGAINHTYPLVN